MSRSSPGATRCTSSRRTCSTCASRRQGQGAHRRAAEPAPVGCVGHDGTVVVRYRVFGDRVDGTYLGVDSTHAHMNMPASLMWAAASKRGPARVSSCRRRASRGGWRRSSSRPTTRWCSPRPPALLDGQPDRVQQLHAADLQRDAARAAADVPHRAAPRRHRGGRGRVRARRRDDRPRNEPDLRRVSALREQHLHVPRPTICRGPAATAWSIATARCSRARARCATRRSGRACSAPWRTSSFTPGTWSASARGRSSRSTSRTPTCRASCGLAKASRATTTI